jgi:WD40 repeat protein
MREPATPRVFLSALSGFDDRTLRLWDLETGAELACLTFDAAPITLTWSEEMNAAVVGDAFGVIHVIELIETRPGGALNNSA